jgi:hypothetical protein
MQILQQQQPAPLGEPARMFASHGNIGQVLLQICTTRCKKVTRASALVFQCAIAIAQGTSDDAPWCIDFFLNSLPF